MLKTEWGDAQVWMNIAENLYLRHAKDPNDFLRDMGGFPRTNEMNVAVVCAGFAFELIFKVIVRAAGGKPDPKHPPRDAYNKLKELDDGEVHAEINKILADNGWAEPDQFLEYLDGICHRDRKYWMRPKDDTEPGTVVISVGGRMGLDALKKLHEDLSRLAMDRIESNPFVQELWPGAN